MVFRMPVLFFVLFIVLSISVEAKTVVSTDWKELEYCVNDGLRLSNTGSDRTRIRITRVYDDGSREVKFMWKLCADECECWHETEWGEVQGPQDSGLPASVDSGGNWLLLGAALGRGGSFVSGTGGVWNFIIDPFSTVIFVPASMAS